jgi:ribose transport system substrate-binding protein
VTFGVVLVVLGLVVAGCGSSSSSSSSGSASGAESGSPLSGAALRQVQAAVQPHLSRPTSLGITQPVASVPKGKTIYFVYGSFPVTLHMVGSAQQAAQALGWTLKPKPVQQLPQAFQEGFDVALRDPATSGIISTGVPTAAISSQLHEAAAKHIPVVIIAGNGGSDSEHIAIGGSGQYSYGGTLEADYVLAQTHGRAHVLVTTAAAVPTEASLVQGFRAEWAKMCPKCQAPLTYDAPLTSFGKNFPALLTAYLEAHRSVKYIVFGFNDMMIGVPQALQAAGIKGVKGLTFAQDPSTNPLIGAGMLQADVAVPLVEFGWVGMDALLRSFDHMSTAPDSAFTGSNAMMDWFITKAGIRKAGLSPGTIWPIDPDYEQQFKKLWGVK